MQRADHVHRRQAQDLDTLIDLTLAGNRRAMARLLSVVENGSLVTLQHVGARLRSHTGRARLTGITGPPGAGKSTLTSVLAAELSARGRTVAVLAVDPSSPYTGGALLGDRVRMMALTSDPSIFIRSMAARGQLGGLALSAPAAIAVLDAAGFTDIIVETVGVGQSEVDISTIADTTIVVLAPGMGDSVQAAKAGLLEVADVFVVNKADQPGAIRLESDLRGVARTGGRQGWGVPVLRSVATRNEGAATVIDAVEQHAVHLLTSGGDVRRRQERAHRAVRDSAHSLIEANCSDGGPVADLMRDLVALVVAGECEPYKAAVRLLRVIADIADVADIRAVPEAP